MSSDTPWLGKRPATVPKLSAGPRAYLAVGPGCWGKAFNAIDAEKNAKSNFGSGWGQTWCVIVFDVPADAYVDNFGSICYQPSYYSEEQQRGSVELYRYKATPPKRR